MSMLPVSQNNLSDPSRLQYTMFAGTAAVALDSIFTPYIKGFADSVALATAQWLLDGWGATLTSLYLAGWGAKIATTYTSLETKTKKIAYASFVSLSVAAIHIGAQVLRTGDTTGARFVFGTPIALAALLEYQVGKGSLTGLFSCWKGRGQEVYRPIRNAIIHSVNGFKAIESVTEYVKTLYQGSLYFNAWDKLMEREGETFLHLTKEQKSSFINKFFYDMEREAESRKADVCDFQTNLCTGKSKEDCILALNPECANQAQMILDLSGKTTCKEAVRKLKFEFHPDKNKHAPKDVYSNIQTAGKTLNC